MLTFEFSFGSKNSVLCGDIDPYSMPVLLLANWSGVSHIPFHLFPYRLFIGGVEVWPWHFYRDSTPCPDRSADGTSRNSWLFINTTVHSCRCNSQSRWMDWWLVFRFLKNVIFTLICICQWYDKSIFLSLLPIISLSSSWSWNDIGTSCKLCSTLYIVFFQIIL